MSERIVTRFLLAVLTMFLIHDSTASQISGTIATEPRLFSQPSLRFPNAAYMGRVVGTVWVKVMIGSDGVPVKTDIVRREPEMAYLFDDEARKWAMACRFSPARDSSGSPVSVWEVIPLSFKFDNFTPPECTNQAKPDFPPEAKEMGMEGWVGLAVLVKSNNEVDPSQILVVAREPAATSIFDRAAKDAASHSQYRAAALQASAVEGWCFIKVSFKIEPRAPQTQSSGQ